MLLVGLRGVEGDVTGQMDRDLTGPPCRPSEGWEVFPKNSRELGTGFPADRGRGWM